MERTLSCLSCLEFLGDRSDPGGMNKIRGVFDSSVIDEFGAPAITLVCGHSICKSCFAEHSDPQSKDSLVFCEDCKIETKNKNLRELKTIRNICDNYKIMRDNNQKIMALLKGCLDQDQRNDSIIKRSEQVSPRRQKEILDGISSAMMKENPRLLPKNDPDD